MLCQRWFTFFIPTTYGASISAPAEGRNPFANDGVLVDRNNLLILEDRQVLTVDLRELGHTECF